MCDVPWAHLARLVKEHDDWKEEAHRLTTARLEAYLNTVDKARTENSSSRVEPEPSAEGNIPPVGVAEESQHDQHEGCGVGPSPKDSQSANRNSPLPKTSAVLRDGDYISIAGKTYQVEVPKS